MTKDKALKMALEALTYIYTETTADEDELFDKAITALRLAIDVQNMASESTYKEALAQPVQPEQKFGAYAMAHINLETETRGTVDTATAAHYLNYSKQTLLRWACEGSGPIKPHRVEGARKLQWRVADIRKLVGVAA